MYDDEEIEPEEEWVERPRDAKVDEAKRVLGEFFREYRQEVFYHRQITVHFEGQFFHWITGKAARELEEEGKIAGETVVPKGWTGKALKFFFSPTNRYWKRKAKSAAALVARFSTTEFGRALGFHGETMIDAAVPRAGLLPVSKNANAYGGRSWTQSEHELDRVYSRKGIAYGVEIKNTLDYIPKSELDIKLAMSGYLGLVPIFVVRMAPKSYVHLVQQAGGFTWIMKYQFYPFGHEELAREVRAALGFPVDSPRSLQDGTLKRLVEFVERKEREFGR